MPNVADKVLTQRLKDLEALGLMSKEPINGQRTHVYRLTKRGESRILFLTLSTFGDRRWQRN